jgi:hypothetical protein
MSDETGIVGFKMLNSGYRMPLTVFKKYNLNLLLQGDYDGCFFACLEFARRMVVDGVWQTGPDAPTAWVWLVGEGEWGFEEGVTVPRTKGTIGGEIRAFGEQ